MAKQGALSALSNGGLSELWARLRFLFLAIIVYRIGAHIPVPGIDPNQMAQLFKSQEGGILSLFNMFSGGALSRFAVFALGIMPYISASIIMQLGAYVIPALEQLKKEGEAGHRAAQSGLPDSERSSAEHGAPRQGRGSGGQGDRHRGHRRWHRRPWDRPREDEGGPAAVGQHGRGVQDRSRPDRRPGG